MATKALRRTGVPLFDDRSFAEARSSENWGRTAAVTEHWRAFVDVASDCRIDVGEDGLHLVWTPAAATVHLSRSFTLPPAGPGSETQTLRLTVGCPGDASWEETFHSVRVEEATDEGSRRVARFGTPRCYAEKGRNRFVSECELPGADLRAKLRLVVKFQAAALEARVLGLSLDIEGGDRPAKPARETREAEAPRREAPPTRVRGDRTVLVVSSNMAANPAGRAFLLADLMRSAHDVRLTGPMFSSDGPGEIWAPLKGFDGFAVSGFPGRSFPEFFTDAISCVRSFDPDVVVASKPRLSSLLIGLLFHLVRGSRLVVDIDDYELGFFPGVSSLPLEKALEIARAAPAKAAHPNGPLWTGLAEDIVRSVKTLTVSNTALQRRFGGEVVAHARDEGVFVPDSASRARVRHRFGLSPQNVVVAFIGTPREHKGILRVAEALERIGDRNLVFVIVGRFVDPNLKARLRRYKRANVRLFDDKPWARLPELIRMADVVVALQEADSAVAQHQMPAKISEALACGAAVLATATDPLKALIARGVAVNIHSDRELDAALRSARRLEDADPAEIAARRSYFLEELSFAANAPRLRAAVAASQAQSDAGRRTLAQTVVRLADHFGVDDPMIEQIRRI